jgi:hypothetical protein
VAGDGPTALPRIHARGPVTVDQTLQPSQVTLRNRLTHQMHEDREWSKEFPIAERGSRELKGLPGRWQLFALDAANQTGAAGASR